MIGRLFILVIRAYQVTLAPLFGNCCRFYPSCSNYCIGAIQKHGWFKGLVLGMWRLCRCNPFNYGGVDLVPERGTPMRDAFRGARDRVAGRQAAGAPLPPGRELKVNGV